MLDGHRIAIVVPALDPDGRLAGVVAGIPDWADRVVVVDDGSRAPVAAGEGRVRVVRHPRNLGVGASILTGYRIAREEGADVAVVMAADGQMLPSDLDALLRPVVAGEADYAKGDRLSHPACSAAMPLVRRLGNTCLTFLTRLVTGSRDLMDSQCGFTALRLDALARLPLDWIYPRYGFPNDFLAAAAGAGLRVRDVVVTPVYRGERSGIRPPIAAAVYPLLLVRAILVRAVASRKARAAAAAAGGMRCGS
jgi:glycosyltransferase involved in cell wall biosynthesis